MHRGWIVFVLHIYHLIEPVLDVCKKILIFSLALKLTLKVKKSVKFNCRVLGCDFFSVELLCRVGIWDTARSVPFISLHVPIIVVYVIDVYCEWYASMFTFMLFLDILNNILNRLPLEYKDHHCVWMNNCVGHANYKIFFIFVLYAVIACIYSLVRSWHFDAF